jgi:hypothetical protein
VAPSKIPRNAPLYVMPQTKKMISWTFKIRGILVFLCPKERERERANARERERKRKQKLAIIFLNRPAKMKNPQTTQYI